MSDFAAGSDPRTAALIQLLMEMSQNGGGAGVTTPFDQLSFGYDPSAMQNSLQYGALPAIDEEGGTVEDMAKRANLLQDTADLAMDPYYAGQAGGGAFAADAFAPTVTYEVVPTPGIDALSYYATSSPNTVEGLVAIGILQQGRSASDVVNMLRVRYEQGTDEEKAMIEQAVGPYLFPDETGTPTVHWNQVLERVLPMEQDYLRDPKPGQGGQVLDPDGNVISSGGNYVMGADGQLLREIIEESPLAEHYHEAGLPLPTDTYTPESLMTDQWRQASALYEASAPGLEAGLEATHAASDSAAQRWLDAQADVAAGTLDSERNDDIMGLRSGVGSYVDEDAEADTGPEMFSVAEAAGTIPVSEGEMAALETMTNEELRQFVDAHPNLPLDQRQAVADQVNHGVQTTYGTDEYTDWTNLAGDVDDWIEEVTAPEAVTEDTMEAYLQTTGAMPNVGPGEGLPGMDALDGLLQGRDAGMVQSWMSRSWGLLSAEEREEAAARIRTHSAEITSSLIGSDNPDAATERDAWRAIDQQARDFIAAETVTDWNERQTAAQVGGGPAGMGGPIFGGGAGESIFAAGAGPMPTTEPEPPPDFWTGTPTAPTAQQSIAADRYAAGTAAMQGLLPTQSGGTLPTYYGPETSGQGAPPIGDTFLAPYPPSTTAPAFNMAMLRALIGDTGPQGTPPGYSVQPQVPAEVHPHVRDASNVAAQFQTFGQQQMLEQMQRALNGDYTAAGAGPTPGQGAPPIGDTFLAPQSTPGQGAPPIGDTFLPPQMGPPSNPAPLPDWMNQNSIAAPSTEAGPTQSQGQNGDPRTLALIRSLFESAGGGGALEQTPYSAQNQETASADAYSQGAPGNISSPQSMLAAQGGNRPPALRGTLDAAVRGGAEGGGRGVGRTAPKITSRLQSRAAQASQQWLAEDKRIRQLQAQVYGGDYQRSRARSTYLQMRGITPYTEAMANRQGALTNRGLGY